MSLGEAVFLMRGAIFQIMILSAPMLLIGLIVGLLISILQATTSIQEQTLTFVPKIAAMMLSLIIFGPWMFAVLAQYTIQLFRQIPMMVR